jgi:hypothetical protein
VKRLWSYALIASVVSPCSFALGEHEFDWSSRLRYANVDADNSGQAASLLLRGTVESEWNDIFSSTLEADAIGSAFRDDHSDGVDFNNQPLIPDPPGTEINQAFISANLESVNINLGRQRINFDNQRFIGGNGFWQNEQTFDALLARVKIASNSNLTYSYIDNVNRIYGDEADKNNSGIEHNYDNLERSAAFLGDHQHHSHLSRLEWNEWDYTRVVAYGYRIDNRDLPAVSNNTLGISYNLNYKIDSIKYRVQIEAAQQDRFEINTDSLPYYLIDFGLGINTYEISARYEILGSKDNSAFITPLGSNHDFEGWADEIGNTPDAGVRNFSIGLLWRASPFRVETSYHFFEDDQQGQNIGREFDLDFIYKPARKHSISLRFANFEPADNATSIRKVYLDYSFNL